MRLRKKYMMIFIGVFVHLLIFNWAFETPVRAQKIGGHWVRGMKYLKEKNYQRAEGNIAFYLRNPTIQPNMKGLSHFGLGLLYQDLKKNDKAVEQYLHAIQNDLHPKYPVKGKSYMNLGTIYMERKDYEGAINVYTQAVKLNQDDGLAHYYLGLAYFKSGQYELAGKESIRAEELGVPFTALSDKLAKIHKGPVDTGTRDK